MTISKAKLTNQLTSFSGSLIRVGEFDEQLLSTIVDTIIPIYTRDKPRKVETIIEESNIVKEHFRLSLLNNWIDDFSTISLIEDSDIPPNELDFEIISKYIKVDKCSNPPYVVNYTTLHVFDDGESSIPEIHSTALLYLGLSELCTTLALRYEQGSRQGALNEMLSFDTKARDLRQLSSDYRERYKSELNNDIGVYSSKERYRYPRLKDELFVHNGLSSRYFKFGNY